MGISGHPYLNPDCSGIASGFSPLRVMLGILICTFYCVEVFPVVIHTLGLLSWSHFGFVKGFFFIYWDDRVIFLFKSIYAAYYIYWLVNVEPCLHLRDKANLVMVHNPFDVCLYSVCKCFTECFWIYVQQGYWPLVSSFIVVFLPGFGIRVTLASHKRFGSALNVYIFFLNSLRRIACRSLKVW